MPTAASFRFSTYLTLALACAVLGYAERELLPEVPVFGAVAVVALAALCALESRVAFLSIPAANRLGMAVGVVFLAWAAYRIKRELNASEFTNTGWQMFVVAMCGPFVMMLIVAKAARGEKHAGDYWTLHGIALAGVGLGAALAEHPTCFVLIALYLGAAVWSLTLFHLARARGSVPSLPGGEPPATHVAEGSGVPTGHRTDLGRALLWAALAVTGAIPLYLLTPRSAASKADFGQPRIEIGYSADQMVNLNRTGPLRANSEIAFEFTATYPDGTPKPDVNPSQRWRGKVLRSYASGEWRQTDLPGLTVTPLARRADPWVPPSLGPGQFALNFDVPAKLRGIFVADPVFWVPDQQPPLAHLADGGRRGWRPMADGNFFWDPPRESGTTRHYIQEYRTGGDPDAGPPFRFTDHNFESTWAPLRQNPVPPVKDYANRVLDGLIRAGELPPDCREERTLMPKPEYREAVARKFALHLASTPELRYTTDLRRENTRVDPIEDFLFYSKLGHCERYATALVLMLRSQGIPAAFVLGFKGCEHDGDGHYLVKQEYAHAWAEALVPVPVPGAPGRPGEPPGRAFRWLSLDPTPGAGSVADPARAGWVERANSWVESRFREYIQDYTAEQRKHALARIVNRLARTETLGGIAVAIVLVLGVRFARRLRIRREPAPEEPEPARWFGELVALLAAHGIVAAPGDTAREFASAAAALLRLRPGCGAVAEVPLEWAGAYYQDRFGGMPPSDARWAELESGFTELGQALKR